MKRTAAKAPPKASKPKVVPKSALPAKPLPETPTRVLTLPGTPPFVSGPDRPKEPKKIASTLSETEEEFWARAALNSALSNGAVALKFTAPSERKFGLIESIEAMVQKIEALNKGDTGEIKHMLLTQAVALQSIFGDLAGRAAANLQGGGEYLPAGETYMRLALRAQSQSKAALEALAEIVNPRPVYINPGQVNHSAGSQQVNNAAGPQQVNNGASSDHASARASENASLTNKVLESQ